jgi:hypothetical protein
VRFSATVESAGNATGVEVPAAVVNALGSGRRPEVVITIGGHTWSSRVVSVGGRFIAGISAANRPASGIDRRQRGRGRPPARRRAAGSGRAA